MCFLNNLRTDSDVPNISRKVVSDAGVALSSLVLCEEALQQELFISTSYVPQHFIFFLSSRWKPLGECS